MSISKLLMMATVCTINMAAVSTSFCATAASADSFAADDDGHHSSLTTLATSNSAGWTGFPTGRTPIDRDAVSVGSRMSTISHDRLVPALKNLIELLKQVPREVTFPDGKVTTAVPGGKPTQLDLILTGYTNLVRAYMGLAIIAKEDKGAAESLARVLARAKGGEVVAVEESKDSMEDQIVDAIHKKELALNEAETKVIKAEVSTTRWKASAIITSSVLIIVAGVLLNILRNHGVEILWESSR